MKPSPIQLLQSTIETISIKASDEFTPEDKSATGEDIALLVQENCQPFRDYWDSATPPLAPGIEDRTFAVRLGIRSDPEHGGAVLAYEFDLLFSGVVACLPERTSEFDPEQMARQYGFAMIYGAMREQFLTLTSRMPNGPRLLPTVSFMESKQNKTPPRVGKAPNQER
jgi:hypothetical protein